MQMYAAYDPMYKCMSWNICEICELKRLYSKCNAKKYKLRQHKAAGKNIYISRQQSCFPKHNYYANMKPYWTQNWFMKPFLVKNPQMEISGRWSDRKNYDMREIRRR